MEVEGAWERRQLSLSVRKDNESSKLEADGSMWNVEGDRILLRCHKGFLQGSLVGEAHAEPFLSFRALLRAGTASIFLYMKLNPASRSRIKKAEPV